MVGKNFCLALSAVWCLLLSLAARCSVTFHRASLTLTVCAVVTLGGAAIAGKIYQWTDEQGNIHFGDRPPVGDQDTVEDISDRIKSGDIRLDKPTGIEDMTLDEVQAEIREILKRNANGMPVILAEDIKKFAKADRDRYYALRAREEELRAAERKERDMEAAFRSKYGSTCQSTSQCLDLEFVKTDPARLREGQCRSYGQYEIRAKLVNHCTDKKLYCKICQNGRCRSVDLRPAQKISAYSSKPWCTGRGPVWQCYSNWESGAQFAQKCRDKFHR